MELPTPSEMFKLSKGTGPFIRMCPMPGAMLEGTWISSELGWEERGLEIRGRRPLGKPA